MKEIHLYKTEDFLLDESFLNWIRTGKSSENDWHRILNANPELNTYAQQAEKLLSALKFQEEVPSEYRVGRIKNSLDREIKHFSFKPEKTSRDHGSGSKNDSWNWFKFFKVAVAACLFILIGFIYFQKSNSIVPFEIGQKNLLAKKTEKGQKLTVQLSDGSLVKLNSGSTLTYDEFFSDTSRVVQLEGEAFFDIKKDTLRPFRVVTKYSTITALGTSFNIRIDDQSASTYTSLKSGKVSVSQEHQGESELIYLHPGQQAIAHPGEAMVIKDYEENELAWTKNILTFKGESYQQVFDKLEKWYGVEFQVADESGNIPSWNYSASFENESLETVLRGISYVKGFSYEKRDKKIFIKFN